jgi:hypothetical protein
MCTTYVRSAALEPAFPARRYRWSLQLKESFAICDAAFAALTDAQANEMVKMGPSGFQLSKLSLLVSMISHSNEQHGYMAVYLRLKGIVPPSTEAMNAVLGPFAVRSDL